jgi:glycosyltransferase involved in cell wall biosynthesis
VKVLHLIDHLGLGGSQALMLDLLEVRDRSDDHRVWTLADRPLPATTNRLRAAGVPHRSLALSRLDPLALPKLRAMIVAERPDVLHTHLDNSNSLGVAAALAGRFRPRIVCSIENDPGQHYGAVQRFLLRWLAPRVDAHVFVSDSLRDSSRSVLGDRCRRVEVLPPALDLERFDPSRVPAAETRRLRNGASIVVGSVGRLAWQKAYEVLLDATPALLEVDRGTRILIVGDGPLRAELEAQARRLGIEHAVRLPGYRPDVEVGLSAMDVFVLPSRHEGFGIVVAEAMAMGVPIVATRVVGTVDALGNDRGLLVPFGDPTALAAAIRRVLSDRDLAARLVRTAREWVVRECRRERAAATMRTLYEEIVNGRLGPREEGMNV